MGYRALKALLALVVVPGVASAQSAPVSGATMRLQRQPVVHPVTPGGQWHVVSRPRGWVWGRPGWWGGSYQPPAPGYILPSFWLSPEYVVPDWSGYGFQEPGRGRRWVRYYDDAVLVDGRGMIYDSVHDVQWGRYSQGPVPAYVGGAPDGPLPYGAGYDYDYDDEVTWAGGNSSRSDRQIWAWPVQGGAMQGNPVIVVPPGSTMTITFQPQQVVTTTSAAPDYERPATTWKAAPRVKEQPRSSTPPRVIGRVPVKKS